MRGSYITRTRLLVRCPRRARCLAARSNATLAATAASIFRGEPFLSF